MTRFKFASLAMLIIALLISLSAATSAVALPTILLLPENASSSILLTILSNALATALETELSSLSGKGISGTIHFPNGNTTLGFTILRFSHIKEKEQECHTGTDAEGEVLVPQSQIHLVFDTLTPLGIAGLILVPEFEMVCGLTKVKLTGSLLVLIHNINKEISTTEDFQLLMHCKSPGIPLETRWWNDAGVAQAAHFAAKFGTGSEGACENIAGTLLATPNVMVGIMG